MPTTTNQGYGNQFSPAVKDSIKLTMAFTNALGKGQDQYEQNLIVSPYNAAMCLSMVALGADTQTRDEFAKTLFNVSGAELDEKAKAFVDLNSEILDASKSSVTLKSANGIWVNSDKAPLKTDYETRMRGEFNATIANESFQNPAVVDDIAVIAQIERKAHVLLGQQHGEAGLL